MSAGRGEVTVDGVSQRIWSLVQSLKTVDTSLPLLGSDKDTVSWRAKLVAHERRTDTLRQSINMDIRQLQNEASARNDLAFSKGVDRLAAQFAELQRRVTETIQRSQRKQRTVTPKPDPGTTAAAAGKGGGAAAAAGAGRPPPETVLANPMSVMVEMHALNADELIEEENRADAAYIAQEAIEVSELTSHIAEKVHEAGEKLDQVEEKMDITIDKVVAANKDLVKAAQYQNSCRKKCFFAVLLLLACVAIVVIPIALHVAPSK